MFTHGTALISRRREEAKPTMKRDDSNEQKAMTTSDSPQHRAREQVCQDLLHTAAGVDAATVRRAFASQIIAVSGPVAAGKTTLGRAMELLCAQHGLACLFAPEVVNSEALGLYIEHQHVQSATLYNGDDNDCTVTDEAARCNNPYAMAFQVHMLADCQHRVREARVYLDVHRSCGTRYAAAIVDRTAWDNTVFEEANRRLCGAISAHDARYYRAVAVGAPSFGVDQLVFLDIPPEVTLERIGLRGASAEAAYQSAYMHFLHDIWFHRIVNNYAAEHPFAIHIFAWDDFSHASLGDVVQRLAAQADEPPPIKLVVFEKDGVPPAFHSAERVHWTRDYAASTYCETRTEFKRHVLSLLSRRQRIVCV